MTETEWMVCSDPTPMLEVLRGKASERKLRLFACACCRRIWTLMTDERSQTAVEIAEQYADGLVAVENLVLAHEDAAAVAGAAHDATFLPNDETNEYPPSAAKFACDDLRLWDMHHAAGVCAADAECAIAVAISVKGYRGPNPRTASRAEQAALLHDIFGPLLFRPIILDPTRLSLTVKQLAEVIYETRAFDRLPILADALEDAGCTSQDILNHCRQPGVHVRGCWPVDLVLRRE